MPIERKLAAIMFTDIAGYTESMSKSESKSLDTLEKKRSILVQEKTYNLGSDIAAIFPKHQIPKATVNEWKRVKSNKYFRINII